MAKKNLNETNGLRQKTHESVDNIMDKAESIEERGKEKMVRLKENAMKVKENVDDYIQENPERSVLIAAGIGIVAGIILTATLMRKKHQVII